MGKCSEKNIYGKAGGYLFNQANHIALDAVVNGAVAGESPAALHVTAHAAHYAGVFHTAVQVADERPTGEVRACHHVERSMLLQPRNGVEHRYRSG